MTGSVVVEEGGVGASGTAAETAAAGGAAAAGMDFFSAFGTTGSYEAIAASKAAVEEDTIAFRESRPLLVKVTSGDEDRRLLLDDPSPEVSA
jgi:hypothetical protein